MTQPSFFRRLLLATLTCIALAIVAVAIPIATAALTPAQAQVSAEFQSALEPYGHWVRHGRWGEVWVPDDVPPGWRPYSYGRWIYTEEWGWYWVSDEQEEDWGWVTFHYGRWAHDRRLGWFWIPDDEWAPAWVDWRRGDDYVGWAPLPPDEVIYEYDDTPAYWVFVPFRYLLAPQLHRHFLPPRRTTIIIRNTALINRTVVLEHRRNGRSRIAVNAGISPAIVAAARRSPVSAFRVNPHVLPGTRGVVGAVAVRPQDLARPRPGQRNRALAPRIQRTNVAVQPAARVTKPQPLGRNEPGRLGSHPPRAAQGAVIAPPSTPQPQQQTAPPPAQRTAPSTQPPALVAPTRPRDDRNQRAPITRQGEPPPPPQVRTPQPPVSPPSQVKPRQPTAPQPPPQLKPRPPTAPHAPPPPAARPTQRPPAIRSAPPPRPVTPGIVRPSAPPQVNKPPPARAQPQRPPPAQVHRPAPAQRQAPAGARKPPPKKPGDKKGENKDKK